MPLTLSWQTPPPGPTPAESSRIAAFFDFDGTLVRGAVGGYVFREMRRRRMIPRRKLVAAFGYRLLYSANLATGVDIYRFGYRLLAGMTLEEAKHLTDDAMEAVYRNVYTEGVAAIEEHRSKGHFIAAVTGAPEYGAFLLCKKLGIDHLVCTPTPIVGDRLGTEVDVERMCYGEGKVRRLKELAATWGLDLERSYAYADSASDLPFLAAVGNPRVVNPQWLLSIEAKKRGWPVLTFSSLSDARSSTSPRRPS
jgi:putative phosphoserine phosphatase / 1-acylglycerol-3-phosphate O-acyltransferase